LVARHRRPQLGERDSILLTDFENNTGEPVLDGALKEAAAVELGQSPFLNIVSNDRVRETLRFMSRSPDEHVQALLAREVCERVGAKAYITGSVNRIGTGYVLVLRAVNCADGTSFARESAITKDKEALLPALDQTAAKVRRELGESLASIQRFDVHVEDATTSSLEALKAYSLGTAQTARGAIKDAIPFLTMPSNWTPILPWRMQDAAQPTTPWENWTAQPASSGRRMHYGPTSANVKNFFLPFGIRTRS